MARGNTVVFGFSENTVYAGICRGCNVVML